ncbi:hypothetical protein MESS2_110113 [Mesorhizobium metallidurans STM 2683]|uniref:Uncharacterized protein n=1 Tax=Mesorhizobium metallidurans STM 2683 TaxID=1297569 RepID=M5EHT0_9HYPH|nr:hypothetical protein MESS2_110113 [Mesorhizobium metallidurans STM 2683]
MSEDPGWIVTHAAQNLEVGSADAGNEGPAHKIAR